MTDEELKYYIALQPVFKAKMGDWQGGDRGYCITHNHLYFFNIDTDRHCCNNEGVWLPLPIDPENPERGLTGMLNGKGLLYLSDIYLPGDMLVRFLVDKNKILALLKALAAQEWKE